MIYKKNFYHDKEDEIDEIFYGYHIPLLNDIDHTVLIEERKKIDAAAYEKNGEIKLPSNKKEIYCRARIYYWLTSIN